MKRVRRCRISAESIDYRDILLSKYESIRANEKRYSFRRFAHDIGITPSNLSDIFKGRCGLSTDGATRIAEALKMSAGERLYFLDLVEVKHARNKAEREAAVVRLKKREESPFKENASEREMSVLDRWYYLATLELVELSRGEIEAEALARKLDISIIEAARSFDVLMKIGLITFTDGKYVRTKNEFNVVTPTPSRLIRDFHQQLLDVASRALEEQPMENRQFSSLLMTFDSKRIGEARKFLIEMEEEFFRRFEATNGEGDSVYALDHQLFRIDREFK